MIIIVGLGNPGEKFNNTPHNAGFEVLDIFAKENAFPDFTLSKKFNSLTSEKEGVLLVKPQTFMNESGKALKKIVLQKKDQIERIVVVHDDIDLPVGKIKIIEERGSAGHKGVESIIGNIGNQGLIRLRIGIGTDKKTDAMGIVLKKLPTNEQKLVNESKELSVKALNLLLEKGLNIAMNEYNK